MNRRGVHASTILEWNDSLIPDKKTICFISIGYITVEAACTILSPRPFIWLSTRDSADSKHYHRDTNHTTIAKDSLEFLVYAKTAHF